MIATQNQSHEILLRLKTVLSMIPVSKSSWWDGIKKGRFPKPVRLGPKTPAWKESDILALIKTGAE